MPNERAAAHVIAQGGTGWPYALPYAWGDEREWLDAYDGGDTAASVASPEQVVPTDEGAIEEMARIKQDIVGALTTVSSIIRTWNDQWTPLGAERHLTKLNRVGNFISTRFREGLEVLGRLPVEDAERDRAQQTLRRLTNQSQGAVAQAIREIGDDLEATSIAVLTETVDNSLEEMLMRLEQAGRAAIKSPMKTGLLITILSVPVLTYLLLR